MKAARVERLGEAPRLVETEEPAATSGEVIVPVVAAGLNPIDLHLASGRYGSQPTPHTIGREGVVDVDGTRRYFTAGPLPAGSAAERVAVDPASTFEIPDQLPTALAIAVGIAGSTALLALQAAGLQRGESVLVLGASGAVGQLAVQVARALGASRVVGAARDTGAAAGGGADALVRLDAEARTALQAVAERGFDVVIDPVGGTPLSGAVHATADGARIVTLGVSAGHHSSIDTKALQGRTLIGYSGRFAPAEARRAAYATLVEHAVAGRLHLPTDTLPIGDVTRAWTRQEDSPHRKLILTF